MTTSVVQASALSGSVDVTQRLAPILLFLVCVTVLAELADAAQVFDIAAVRAARLAGGRTPVLFALMVVLGVLTTIALSLDTTAVLFTPVVLALAARLKLSPLPFAFLAVWIANTASLLLPISNLTNLLAVDRLGLSTTAYVRHTAPAAIAAIVVTVGFLAVWQRRALRGRYEIPQVVGPDDIVLTAVAGTACVLLVPALLAGVAVQWAALAAASVVVAGFAWRKRSALRLSLVPWRLVVMVEVLFLAVQAAGPLFLDDVLRQGVDGGGPLQTAAVAAGAANIANNLPAYLALERVVPHSQLLALLIGVNVGPLVLPWGSLATLLWAERCRARGVRIGWGRFALAGLCLVPLVLLASVPLLP